ncbi:MAG: hypothetical protein WBB28_10025 [Crinalium sp.]
MISFKTITQQHFYDSEAYLQSTYNKVDWTNTKLQRIEKKLGTAPKK